MKEHETVNYDIFFLHPPSSFNKVRFPLSGCFPSGTLENDLFLHAPIGINALYHRLKREGFNPGFLNIGRLFYKTNIQGERFDPAKIIADLPAKGFGIDLHWVVHAPGALDLAKIIKKKCPDSFVFLGGMTATYFFQEILKEYPYIDAVVLGEADEAIVPLVETLKKDSINRNLHLENVPNLAYRSGKDGRISVNPIRIPKKWENVSFQYVEEELSCGYICIKGCILNCPSCGGSQFSYRNFFHRESPLALEPQQLVQEIKTFEKNGLDSVILIGDIRIMGENYVDSFLTKLYKEKFNINIMQEIYFPAESEYLERWKKATSRCFFNFKIESVDPRVLQKIGKGYTDKDIWNLIKICSSLGIPLELFSIFPLPEQDAHSIRLTMDFFEQAVDYPHIDFLIEPLFYISPGSPFFENPEEWGYHIKFRTIKDFKKHLEKPHWSQSIGYHTRWLSEKEIIDMIFYVAERTNRIRFKQSPGYTPLYLLNIENQELNLKLIEQLREKESISEIDTDDYVRNSIKIIFPPYLLKDNLLRKTQMPKNDRVPYTLFPDLSYLLIRAFHVSTHQLLIYFKKWFEDTESLPKEISLEEFKRVTGAPSKLKKEILDFTSTFNINTDFVDNLLDFEWLNDMSTRVNINKEIRGNNPPIYNNTRDYSKYKLILNKSVVLKRFKFDFDQVNWKSFSSKEPVIPVTTYCLYFLQKKKRKMISSFTWKLLNLCDGKRHVAEIINELKGTEQKGVLNVAVNLGVLVSEGILLPQL